MTVAQGTPSITAKEVKGRIRVAMKLFHNAEHHWDVEMASEWINEADPTHTLLDWIDSGIDQLEAENAALSAQVAQGKEAAFFADAPNPLDAPPRRTEVEALKAQLRENLIRSVEIASEKDERIEKLSAQVVELQHDLTRHMDIATEHVNRVVELQKALDDALDAAHENL